ncbi:hypothetical protein C9374_011413 [Naegleria lovaniensis]|uniref:Uncharacterized protein n=1 Tax=Naegleria lovaniensis TaxID=51637 RepID=A0AA88GX78_NAELO|nr:uncharacterized protein C9374_011413 [Naegleria lovaniensis]KAG2392688.1 hypothetical protein C9374_011413 [Naegleria lovaniensis]
MSVTTADSPTTPVIGDKTKHKNIPNEDFSNQCVCCKRYNLHYSKKYNINASNKSAYVAAFKFDVPLGVCCNSCYNKQHRYNKNHPNAASELIISTSASPKSTTTTSPNHNHQVSSPPTISTTSSHHQQQQPQELEDEPSTPSSRGGRRSSNSNRTPKSTTSRASRRGRSASSQSKSSTNTNDTNMTCIQSPDSVDNKTNNNMYDPDNNPRKRKMDHQQDSNNSINKFKKESVHASTTEGPFGSMLNNEDSSANHHHSHPRHHQHAADDALFYGEGDDQIDSLFITQQEMWTSQEPHVATSATQSRPQQGSELVAGMVTGNSHPSYLTPSHYNQYLPFHSSTSTTGTASQPIVAQSSASVQKLLVELAQQQQQLYQHTSRYLQQQHSLRAMNQVVAPQQVVSNSSTNPDSILQLLSEDQTASHASEFVEPVVVAPNMQPHSYFVDLIMNNENSSASMESKKVMKTLSPPSSQHCLYPFQTATSTQQHVVSPTMTFNPSSLFHSTGSNTTTNNPFTTSNASSLSYLNQPQTSFCSEQQQQQNPAVMFLLFYDDSKIKSIADYSNIQNTLNISKVFMPRHAPYSMLMEKITERMASEKKLWNQNGLKSVASIKMKFYLNGSTVLMNIDPNNQMLRFKDNDVLFVHVM